MPIYPSKTTSSRKRVSGSAKTTGTIAKPTGSLAYKKTTGTALPSGTAKKVLSQGRGPVKTSGSSSIKKSGTAMKKKVPTTRAKNATSKKLTY